MSNNYTSAEAFVDDYLKCISTNESKQRFYIWEVANYLAIRDRLALLLYGADANLIVQYTLALRMRKDIECSLATGESMRMVLLSSGLLIALRRPRNACTEAELAILDEIHDLFNLLI